MQIIKDLIIETEYYVCKNDILSDLSRINIFVGANNSGKSRFLRSIFYSNSGNKLKFLPNDNQFYEFRNQIKIFKSNETKNSMKYQNQDTKQVYNSMYNLINYPHHIIESEEILTEWKSFYDKNHNRIRNFDKNIKKLTKEFFNNIDLNDDTLFKYEFYKIYIPSLRGLLPLIPDKDISSNYGQNRSIFQYVNEDVFAQRIKSDYFGENSDIITDVNESLTQSPKNSIITGHYFYKYVQEFLLGDLEQRQIIKEYQEYLSKNFFKGNEVTLIPKLEDDVLTVKIGDEVERKIYNLGEGIQSIILITLPLFLYLNKVHNESTNILVFIEEPEIGLHPTLQRKLMETFLDERFKNFQFYFTTHSNHFIDRIFNGKNISVYSFDKHLNNEENSNTEFTIENVGFEHIPTLKRLGALPSSVLLDNCTIMVEGTTDKKHYEYYLKLYQDQLEFTKPNLKKYQKNIHYSFSIGGGSEAIEAIKDFTPIEKERIFFILDNDSEEKTLKIKKLFNEINYTNYYFLNVKEVENLISLNSVVNTIKKVYNIKESKMNLNFDENEYYNCDNYYTFIIDTIFNGKKPDKLPNEKNKAKLKNQLAKKEPEFVTDYESLTEEAKNVAIKIYDFIKKMNP